MKTLKTKLGIEVDLYCDYIDHVNIKITASCEEGTKEFFIEHGLCRGGAEDVGDEVDIIGYLTDEINLDISAILKWADMVTVGFIASEIAKICLMKSDETDYWFFNLFTCTNIRLNVYCHDVNNDMNIKEYYSSNGIEEIKNFLEEHKNGI